MPLQHIYMSVAVGKARKKYKVAYPALYADASNKDAATFNCVQRGHQNSLENLAAFNTLLLLSGLRYPVSAAIAGTIYLAGRVQYFRGYSTGDPKKRQRGAFMYIGSLALLGMVGRWAVELLRSA